MCDDRYRYQNTTTHTYGLEPPAAVPHALTSWCAADAAWRENPARIPPSATGIGELTFVFFKVARSGSTWVSSALLSRGAKVWFEPYTDGAAHCPGATRQTECVSRILSGRCRPHDQMPLRVGCAPCEHCRDCSYAKCPQQRVPWGIALNPRFPSVRYDGLLAQLPGGSLVPRVINLRRTNLMRMALSLYDHLDALGHHAHTERPQLSPACTADAAASGGRSAVGAPCRAGQRTMLDLAGFVDRGLRKYCVEEQEYATAAAYAMARGTGASAPLLLLLYEDLVGDASSAAWAALWRYLGVPGLGAVGGRQAASSAAAALAASRTADRCLP